MGSYEISCAIRLADNDASPEYHTRGRSSNLSDGRKNTSSPVSEGSGIYQALRNAEGTDQVIVIPDIDVAIESGILSKDYNLEKYKGEIGSMMVARLNVRNKNTDALWGFLYVVSPEKNAFSEEYKPVLMAVADTVSSSMWDVVESRGYGKGEGTINKTKNERSDRTVYYIKRGRKGR